MKTTFKGLDVNQHQSYNPISFALQTSRFAELCHLIDVSIHYLWRVAGISKHTSSMKMMKTAFKRSSRSFHTTQFIPSQFPPLTSYLHFVRLSFVITHSLEIQLLTGSQVHCSTFNPISSLSCHTTDWSVKTLELPSYSLTATSMTSATTRSVEEQSTTVTGYRESKRMADRDICGCEKGDLGNHARDAL